MQNQGLMSGIIMMLVKFLKSNPGGTSVQINDDTEGNFPINKMASKMQINYKTGGFYQK